MFKKYYKEANQEITNEVLMSRVIANAHRPPKKRTQYIKYAVSLAAAIFVVSSALISMPLWQRVEKNTDIIQSSPSPTTENSVNNAVPTDTPKLFIPPTPSGSDYNNSQNKSIAGDKSKNNDIVLQSGILPSAKEQNTESVISHEAIPQENNTDTLKTEIEIEINEDIPNAEDTDKSYMNSVATAIPDSSTTEAMNDGPIASGSSASSSSVGGGGSLASGSNGGGGGGAVQTKPSVPSVSVPTPHGFYRTNKGSTSMSFASDNGATIRVSYSHCDYSSSPSYSNNGNVITVSFASGGVAYNIYAVGADMSAVEYIVNSLY